MDRLENRTETITTDVLVIGSGGAGMRAAVAAAEEGAEVIILSKGKTGVSGATVTAVADVSVDSRSAINLGFPGDPEDSMEIFAEDIIRGGAFLNDRALVDRFVRAVPDRVEEMIRWGAKVTNFSISPGHSYPRALIINGHNFASVLLNKVKHHSKIRIIDFAVALDLITDGEQVFGAYAIDMRLGKYYLITAKSTIIATGGAMNLFPITTAPNDLIGDGMAMAIRAGADLRDMEFQTFMIGCVSPPSLRGNNYPYILVCRCGAHIYNREGERFLEKSDPVRKERTTRDKLAIAVTKEILEGKGGPNGGVWVSISHLPENLFTYYQEWYETGLGLKSFDPKTYLPDLTRNAIEAAPAAHFWCGGIVIDKECRTTLKNLFAVGECSGGLHGANRLSGNAMAEIIAFGEIAGRHAAINANGKEAIPEATQDYFENAESVLYNNGSEDAVEIKKHIQDLAMHTIGPVREENSLKDTLNEIRVIRERKNNIGLHYRGREYNMEWMDAVSIDNMCDCLEATVRSALERDESIGSHYRSDCNDHTGDLYVTHVSKKGGEFTVSRKGVEE